MDFNEYWKIGCFGEYHDIYAKNLADKFYNAGQQSKQEQVNKLQAQLDELQEEIDALKEISLKNEWQPDWSKAPEWAVCFVAHIDEFGDLTNGMWLSGVVKPAIYQEYPSLYKSVSENDLKFQQCELFGYSGHWYDSVRVRIKTD